MFSWYRPHRDLHIVFWFQVSQDGWDDYEGSKFTVEFQLSAEPIVGEVSSFRQRLGQFLDDSSREEVRKIQNGIICSLTPPPPEADELGLEDNFQPAEALAACDIASFKLIAAPIRIGFSAPRDASETVRQRTAINGMRMV